MVRTMINIHYIQFQSGGHWEDHLKFIINYVTKRKKNIFLTIILNKEINIDEFKNRKNLKIILLDNDDTEFLTIKNKTRRYIKEYIKVKELIKRYNINDLYYDSLDQIYLFLALGFRLYNLRNLNGILYKVDLHYQNFEITNTVNVFSKIKRQIKKISLLRLLNHDQVNNVFTFDPFVKKYINFNGLVYVPDPAFYQYNEPKNYKLIQDINSNYIFSMFGAISKRKGVINLVEAIELIANKTTKNVTLLFAGSIKKDEKFEILRSINKLNTLENITVIIDDRYLERYEINDLVTLSDIILMPYTNFVGSSGVLLWAASSKTLVIAQNTGLIGKLVREYKLGYDVNTSSSEEIADAIISYISKDSRYFKSFSTHDNDLVKNSTVRNFAKIIVESL